MKARLEALLSFLKDADSLEAFQAATEQVCDIYGVLHCVYHWVNSDGERFGAGTYSSVWVDRYLEMDYLRMDPVIFGCFQRFTPANWKDLDWTTKAARAMLDDALKHGLGNQGYSIPLHGPQGQFALFTLNHQAEDDDWAAFIDINGRDLIVLAHEFNRRALEFEGAEGIASPSLSPRELAAIRCLARGLSRAQAAAELGISEHTLRVYIESARHKLGALNTTHAVARALSTGIIIV
ncbi:regulatory LuxR family protein [Maritimibacter alkaliphilus HTCC2654]|jgi:DNA-binding CsgD family transcriptional regulator|uniref:helix-turn-helix transcriptional regulator n=1 Tax=Maritimibacter alkaliphilus TaxID=404236 RepID=UPI0003246AAC|nr:LuxR family transcriptional regulator [Maritimibacter alkaliphilus]MBL6428607.1 LuxR family transcriptional regulator [Maritimibacter sp.]TYP85377.1 regulatory LuxR family protein [Maritimibacter alkaliphilus HTCC2654]